MVWDVHDSWGVYGLQLTVNVDAVDANLAGVANNTIARTLNTYYSGLHLTRYREGDREIPLGFTETLGFLALFGTVLNAAILLIDYLQQMIRKKLDAIENLAPHGEHAFCGLTREAFRSCLLEATQVRLLPIFMTTATTVAGLTSLMFGGGPLFKGLATVFAVGPIIGSTITLFVLPALIALFVENFRFPLVRAGDGN